MSKGDTTENDMIALIFQRQIPSWLGTLATSGLTDLVISLHTADPGEAGTQMTSECAYGGYARQSVTRTSGTGGWTVSGNQASNASLIQFPEAVSGSETITYVAVGTVTSTASTGQILYSGQLNSPRSVSTGIQPQFAIGALVVTED